MAQADDSTSSTTFNQLVQGDARHHAKGRWVWGRPMTASAPAMIHVEIFPGDPVVNRLVMDSFTPEELRLGSEEKWRLYKERRVSIAADLNERAISDNGLILLLKRNGEPTNRLKRLVRAMRPAAKTA